MSKLSRRSRVVLETLLPDDAHPTLKAGLIGANFEDFYREFSRTATWKLRVPFSLALFVAVWIAPLLIGRVPPLTRFDRSTRERALERLFSSRIYLLRQTSLALKLVLSLCFVADPSV